jgi:hypothetical protein
MSDRQSVGHNVGPIVGSTRIVACVAKAAEICISQRD